MLTQIIIDLFKNKLIKVYTVPGSGTIIRDINSPLIKKGTMKFYPSGSVEKIIYETSDLINEARVDHNRSSRNNKTYVQQAQPYKTSQVYSLLNTYVEAGNINTILDNVDIVMGDVPNLVGLMQSGANTNKILQQFGVVYKDKFYATKLRQANFFLSTTSGGVRSCHTLSSFNSNKSQELVTIVASGQIISPKTTYFTNLSSGIKYTSKGYDLDYYNITLVPTQIRSITDQSHYTPVQNPPSTNSGDGGYTTKSFLTHIQSDVYNDYLYYGSDPLQLETKHYNKLTGLSIVDLSTFRVLAVVNKAHQFQRVIICKQGRVNSTVNTIEKTAYFYQQKLIDECDFYRLYKIIKSRQEDCIIGNIDGEKVLYQCSKGVGTQNGLTTIMSFMETAKREDILNNAPLIDQANGALNLYTRVGGDILPVEEIIAYENSLHDLTQLLGLVYSRERVERSVQDINPLGRNMSYRNLHSERVGEVTQDYDSKHYTGGANAYKTMTWPTYTDKAYSGTTGSRIRNVGYGNAVFLDFSDLQTMANNYNKMNNNLSTISISFKGPAKLSDLDNAIGISKYIVDKITQDIGRNTTTFQCRAEVFN